MVAHSVIFKRYCGMDHACLKSPVVPSHTFSLLDGSLFTMLLGLCLLC